MQNGWYSQEDGYRWIAPHARTLLAYADSARDLSWS